MRRPQGWVWVIVLMLAALTVVQYLALGWLLPRYAVQAIRNAFGDEVKIGAAQLRFPFTLVLRDVRLDRDWPLAGFYAKRVVVKPSWIPWRRRTVALRSVDIEQPWIRLSRKDDGTFQWPTLSVDPGVAAPRVAAPSLSDSPGSAPVAEDGWGVSVGTLNLVDGTIAFLDEGINEPFYGALDHISVVAGPLRWPRTSGAVAVAVHGEIVGHGGHAAPIYCSGWLNLVARNLETSCQLEPLALAAFEPYYYEGRTQTRLYAGTLSATSEWSAKSNELEGRIQLTIENVDFDISIGGRTLLDIKEELDTGESAILTGEVKVTGPLDDTTQWHLELVPGNAIVQRLMKPLLDRGREAIRLRLGRGRIEVGISSATEDEMSDIEEASKQVEESLEILTTTHFPEEVAAELAKQLPVPEEELPAAAEVPSASRDGKPVEPRDATETATPPPAEDPNATAR